MVEMNEAAFKKAYDAFAGKKSKMPTKEKLFFAIRTYLEHANKHTAYAPLGAELETHEPINPEEMRAAIKRDEESYYYPQGKAKRSQNREAINHFYEKSSNVIIGDSVCGNDIADLSTGDFVPNKYAKDGMHPSQSIGTVCPKCWFYTGKELKIGECNCVENRVCQHYSMTVNGTCNDCGHKLTDEEWDSYPEGRPSKHTEGK